MGCIAMEKKNIKELCEILKNRDDGPSGRVVVDTVILFDNSDEMGCKEESWASEEEVALLEKHGVKIMHFYKDIQEMNHEVKPALPCKGEDTAVIMHTSGTTGLPKGVVLVHGAMDTASCYMKHLSRTYPELKINHDSVHYSYLPLGHIMEVQMELSCLMMGASIWYFSGDLRKIAEELPMVRPTSFVGVPRVLQKFYDKIQIIGKEKAILGSIMQRQILNIKNGNCRNMVYDALLRKVAAKIGLDRCTMIVTGSAPLAPYLHEFWLMIIPDVRVIQGFAMTETTICGTMQHVNDPTTGHVGGPWTCNLVMLRDVPEMGRMVTNNPPDGEILIGGPMMAKEYYKNPEKTAETFIEARGFRWVASGDIAVMNKNNTLSIVDRKKNIFKLAQGEYVSPERVEGVYSESPSINQIWVYGNSYKRYLVAVVCPALVWTMKLPFFPKKHGITLPPKMSDLPKCIELMTMFMSNEENLKKLSEAIFENLKKYQDGLNGFEKIKAIHVETYMDELAQAFSPENGLTTPSMKLQRVKLRKHYTADMQLQKLYTSFGEAPIEGEHW